MKIGSTQIGFGAPPYVIAELGVNHDGSVERALSMVDQAAESGADAIKLQLFRAEMLMSRASQLAAYQSSAGERDPVEMLRRLELPLDALAAIRRRARERNLHAIVTVFSVELVAEAQRIGWDAYKTASPDIIHRPLLESLAATNVPLIISTGAATLDEVSRAVEWLKPAHERLALLQCVSSYPTPFAQAALGGIPAIQQIYPGPVGYSDHTPERFAGASAAAMGAVILEKHFTYDTRAKGPDHAASLDPAEFAVYVAAAKNDWSLAEKHMPLDEFTNRLKSATDRRLLADDFPIGKTVSPIEQDVRRVSRQSIVATRDIPAGTTITREMVTFKRPGTGLAPFELAHVVGCKSFAFLRSDEPIKAQDCEGFSPVAEHV